MPNITVHFVYLYPDVKNEQWKHLHNFFHPGSINHEGQYILIGRDLDISHHVFARFCVKDWKNNKTAILHLPYNLIAGIREIASHKETLGFITEGQSLNEVASENE